MEQPAELSYPEPARLADPLPAEQVEAITKNVESLLDDLSMPSGFDKENEAEKRKEFRQRLKTASEVTAIRNRGVENKLTTLLREYDQQIVKDGVQLRSYVTNKLIEIADCGDIKHELKALELLGKITDVGLFTDKSEMVVHHKTSADLEAAIRDRIKKLLGENVIDIMPEDDTPASTPALLSLDEELGLVGDETPPEE